MKIDLNKVKAYYERMDETKLKQIALLEIRSLEPDVVLIVIDEIKKRELDSILLDAIEVQVNGLPVAEIESLISKIKKLDCPDCGESNLGLVGGMIRKVRSYILFTQYEERAKIGCSKCINSEREVELIRNIILGWFGIPMGLIRTPQSIFKHFSENKKREQVSNSILENFFNQNIGVVFINKEDDEKLLDLIHMFNSK